MRGKGFIGASLVRRLVVFFSSLKTLLMPKERMKALVRVNVPDCAGLI
jgi:hypothetical protein